MKKGSTLIELILYIALVSGIATASVMFVTDLVSGRVKSVLQENISHNARLSTRRLAHEIRQATQILSVSATDLCLSSPIAGRDPTRIYLDSGRLYLGWGGNCTRSTTSYPLTSADVLISDLSFHAPTLSETDLIIDYSFKISGTNLVGRQEWIYETTASGSASLR